MTGVWVLLGTVLAGCMAGAVLLARNGRVRASRARPAPASLPADVTAALRPHGVTLVQISTTFCAPCRHARAALSTLAERTEGLHHTDLDVTDRPEVARQLGVLRTPTTIAFTGSGRELLRVTGVPKRAELLTALEPNLFPRDEHGSRSEVD
jgi:thioredoxin-like negative regulator of GroEL